MICTCGRLSIGDSRNWNPDCDEHGVGSVWWNSPEQRSKRLHASERTRILQERARAARKAAAEQETP